MTIALSPNVRAAVRDSSQRIVITGAGGWLGLATLELLHDALGDALPDRVHCFGASSRTLTLRSGAAVHQQPLARLADLDERPTLLLHLAFLTKDRAEAMDEAAYRSANRALSDLVLENLDRFGAKSVFVASSGAARFADDPAKSPAMRLYGELKRNDEDAFSAWAGASGNRAVVTRIFNIAGPHINKLQSYALSALMLEAMAGRPIAVRAPHRVVRGYVAIRELMSLVFALLLGPLPAVIRFDTGGEPMELAEVAEAIASLTGGHAVRAALTNAAEDRYVGDRTAYDRLLAGHEIAKVTFTEQLEETRSDLAQRVKRDDAAVQIRD
ncbi:NAD(P)-dependent oxidoreductase [Sphingomonas sp.]|uniref:NAD-dependent epimerase/dehydratase family protein n=1 Tax=Sphingomonas sp. TaxID=28214 RepID=UPI00286CD531|nr:NAD(P)-dependent oxidoreductase [Sphingomonas sp.]